MLRSKKWLAVVRDEHWTLAKVLFRKRKLKILRMSELDLADPFTTAEARSLRLKEWLRRERVPLKKLKTAVSYLGVITRIIVLPKLPAKDLQKLLTEHADQYFTLNIEDYVVDYRVLEHFTEEEQEKQRVLLAALPKSRWLRFYETCREAGFQPRVVDLASDSSIRLYAGLEKTGSDWAVIDLGPGHVEFILLEQGKFFLYSDLELDLGSLSGPELFGVELPGVESGPEAALSPVLQTMGEFLNFFAARHFGKSVDRIFITGRYSDLPSLQEYFADNLGIETQIGFPSGWVTEDTWLTPLIFLSFSVRPSMTDSASLLSSALPLSITTLTGIACPLPKWSEMI